MRAVLSVLVVVGVGSAGIRCQEGPAPLPVAGAWSSDASVRVDVPGDGVVWAATWRWKAGFTAAGVEFVPCLGPDEPSHPLQFALRSVRVGGAELPFARGVAPRREGDEVRFERTQLVERYLLQPEGIEQQFVFTALPQRGELVVDVAVQGDLRHAADGAGHRFTCAAGGVHYGAAVAVDALGRRCAMATRWSDDGLSLVVPGEFVASAALPLVIDPLIGASGSTPLFPKAITATDVACDGLLPCNYVSYEFAFSATDHDIYVARFDSHMNWTATTTIDVSTTNWAKPRIAALAATGLAGVVAQVGPVGSATFQVWGRSVVGSTGSVLAPVALASSANDSFRDPDIGGDNGPGPSRFFFACERLISINASELAHGIWDGGSNTMPPIVEPNGVTLVRRVAVSKSCGRSEGGTEGWAVAYRSEPYQQTSGELRLAVFDRNGQVRNPAGPYANFRVVTGVTPNADAFWDVSSPTDHGLGRRFLITETRVDPVSGSGTVLGHVCDWQGNLLLVDHAMQSTTQVRRRVAVDSDGVRFATAHENVYSLTDTDVWVGTWSFVNGQLLPQDLGSVSGSLDDDQYCAIAANPLAAANRYVVAWTRNDNAGNWRAMAREYLGVAPGGLSTRPTGCGGLSIVASGEAQLGRNLYLSLNGVTGLGAFLGGVPVSNVLPGCGSCLQGADGPILVGSLLSISVPADPAFVGVQLAIQGLQLLPGPGPCLGQFELSDTLDLLVQ